MPSPDMLLPEPSDLYSHLVDQLRFLQNQNGGLARNKANFHKLRSEIEDQPPTDWKLDIDPNWVVRITMPDHLSRTDSKRDFVIEDGYAIIGGIIKAKNNKFDEYSLHLTLLARQDSEVRGHNANAPCCWANSCDNSTWRVAKQYHFDIDIGDNGNESKPITHLQSRGNFKKENLPNGIDPEEVHYCSTPLDKPRVPHPPMDPLLLFQMVADQYGCPNDLVSEHWKPRILESESILWQRYYSRISEHIRNDDRTDLFDLFISNGRLS